LPYPGNENSTIVLGDQRDFFVENLTVSRHNIKVFFITWGGGEKLSGKGGRAEELRELGERKTDCHRTIAWGEEEYKSAP